MALLDDSILGSGLAAFTSNSAWAQNLLNTRRLFMSQSFQGAYDSYYSTYPVTINHMNVEQVHLRALFVSFSRIL